MLQNINNSPLGIEIMPAEKSCEQGCLHCPESNRGNNKNNIKMIDTRVQSTFSLLEDRVKGEGRSYDIHFASKLELFPMLQYPELLEMLRFETDRSISLENLQNKVISKIDTLIHTTKITPKHICFTIVPQTGQLISKEEGELISTIMQSLSGYVDTSSGDKKISCTIRSNFVPEKFYNEIDQILDTSRLKETLQSINDTIALNRKEKPIIGKDDTYKLYKNIVHGYDRQGITYEISNRVIVHQKITENMKKALVGKTLEKSDYLIEQVMDLISTPIHFMITPAGVMINHSSISINNPLFWINHKDFDYMLSRYPEKTLQEIGVNILELNIHMYNRIKEKCEDDIIITKEGYMEFFDQMRLQWCNFLDEYEKEKKKNIQQKIDYANQ